MQKKHLFILLTVIILIVLGFLFIPSIVEQRSRKPLVISATSSEPVLTAGEIVELKVQHISTPRAVKGLYMTACVAGGKTLRENLVNLIGRTELNTVVIDIKDYSGYISYLPNYSWKTDLSPNCNVKDMQDFVKELHQKNIYVIGRLTVFQDPYYSKKYPEFAIKKKSNPLQIWTDKKGLSYLNPASKEIWDRTARLAEDSYNVGFDEINFDYIRYPSDGDIQNILVINSEGKTKSDTLESFFKYLHDRLSPQGIKISADVFGLTTVADDDMGIGQILEKTLPYFDYICPMVYPSHYAKGFHGYKDPNKNVYGVVDFSMSTAVGRTEATSSIFESLGAISLTSSSTYISSTSTKFIQLYEKIAYDKNKLRPWLQDFSYGGHYGPAEVRAQIQATYDSGLNSWLLWSASNVYTESALEK